ILSGSDRWCQGFSEPGAGSDLASLATRATLDGAEWVIDGQKVWTSVAHRANWIFLLARTDPQAGGHRGISFLLCPLDQPGIEIRPIRQLTGDSDFNEVFFTGARTPADLVVGAPAEGRQVAVAELALDIQGLGGLVPRGRGPLRAVRTDDPGAPNSSGSWLGAFLNARAGTIYAGTSEVQRNILAETVLGLPKERRENV